MGCFLVPAAEALVTTVVTKVAEHKEQRDEAAGITVERRPFARKLKWLSNMLWGGSALLAFEHVWHGELIFQFPFLTAAAEPASAAQLLHEMATAGVGMAVIVTLAWGGLVAVSSIIEKRAVKAQ